MRKILIKLNNPQIEETLQTSLQKILSHEDTIIRLSAGLNSFPTKLENAKTQNEFLDDEVAFKLHAICVDLLEQCKGHLPLSAIPHVLSAIDYFVNNQDTNPDFSSLDGFEDDKEVIFAVIKHFNLKINGLNFASEKLGA